jgi:hypothetical protein
VRHPGVACRRETFEGRGCARISVVG